MNRSKPLQRTGFKTTAPGLLRLAEPKIAKPVKRMRSSQRSVTGTEKSLWNRMATEIGCIACLLDGNSNFYVSIHHIDGRTKPGCHEMVLPLCAGHHQDGTGNDKNMVAVHPYKAAFQSLYGTQHELLKMVMERLQANG